MSSGRRHSATLSRAGQQSASAIAKLDAGPPTASSSALQAAEPRAAPPTSAVALAYRSNQAAPRVVAKGNGLIAEAIIARAKSNGVFVHESPALVGMLMQVDLDRDIPPSLYQAVAQLLAWIYRLENNQESIM